MTIQTAKALARERNGRLPKPGYETLVDSTVKPMTLTQEWDGRKVYGRYRVDTYLVNDSGRYRVREYVPPTPERD